MIGVLKCRPKDSLAELSVGILFAVTNAVVLYLYLLSGAIYLQPKVYVFPGVRHWLQW